MTYVTLGVMCDWISDLCNTFRIARNRKWIEAVPHQKTLHVPIRLQVVRHVT